MVTKDTAYLYLSAEQDITEEKIAVATISVLGEIFDINDSVTIIEYGHCYSYTDSLPVLSNSLYTKGGKSTETTNGFTFETFITNLEIEKQYHFRSYVVTEDIRFNRRDTGYNQQTKTYMALPYNIWINKNNFIGEPREEAISFVKENKAYIGLGWNGYQLKKDIFIYNAEDDTWQQGPDFYNARMSAVAFVSDNVAYVGTGRTDYDGGIESIEGDMYKLTPNNVWQRIDSLPVNTERENAVAFALMFNNEWHGYIGLGKRNFALTDLYEYHPELEDDHLPQGYCWKSQNYFPGEQRTEAVAYAVDNNVAIIGSGLNHNGEYKKDFYKYSPDNFGGQWTPTEEFPGPARANAVAFALSYERNDSLFKAFYIATGRTEDGLLNDLYTYNLYTGNWTRKTSMIDAFDADTAAVREGAVAFSVEKSVVDYGALVRGYVLLGKTKDNEGDDLLLRDVWEYLP